MQRAPPPCAPTPSHECVGRSDRVIGWDANQLGAFHRGGGKRARMARHAVFDRAHARCPPLSQQGSSQPALPGCCRPMLNSAGFSRHADAPCSRRQTAGLDRQHSLDPLCASRFKATERCQCMREMRRAGSRAGTVEVWGPRGRAEGNLRRPQGALSFHPLPVPTVPYFDASSDRTCMRSVGTQSDCTVICFFRNGLHDLVYALHMTLLA